MHAPVITRTHVYRPVCPCFGYLRWSTTVPPFKVTNLETEIRWSRWVESMQKDVENTFGILKGRFRVLKTGIRVEGVDCVDKIWLTCCALHNWLLDIDGLDEEWKEGVPVRSDWLGEMGNHEAGFDTPPSELPAMIARISTNLEPRTYDLSGMGPGKDVTESHPLGLDFGEADNISCLHLSGTRVVRKLGLGFFRCRALRM